MMNYHCQRVFRSRVRRIGKRWPGFSVFRTRVHSCSVFQTRAPSWRLFLLTINIGHARRVTYEASWFHVTDGGVCSDWGEFNGCLCRDGNGNNCPSIGDFYSATTTTTTTLTDTHTQKQKQKKGTKAVICTHSRISLVVRRRGRVSFMHGNRTQVHLRGHCGKVFKRRGRPCTLAWRQSSLPLQQVLPTFHIQELGEAS